MPIILQYKTAFSGIAFSMLSGGAWLVIVKNKCSELSFYNFEAEPHRQLFSQNIQNFSIF